MVRNVRQSWISKETGRVKKEAFIPRNNGKDDDGLSVSQIRGSSESELRIRLANFDRAFCTLIAGDIRDIREQTVILDVCPNPTLSDPLHALITGVPTALPQKAIMIRLAQRLAQISSEYKFEGS